MADQQVEVDLPETVIPAPPTNLPETVMPASTTNLPETVIPASTTNLPETTTIIFNSLMLPHKGKRGRGRPKGAATTAIGLPLKRPRKNDAPLRFVKKDVKTKINLLLSWYLTDAGLEKHSRGQEQLTDEDIESTPENIPSCAMHPLADVKFIKDFF